MKKCNNVIEEKDKLNSIESDNIKNEMKNVMDEKDKLNNIELDKLNNELNSII